MALEVLDIKSIVSIYSFRYINVTPYKHENIVVSRSALGVFNRIPEHVPLHEEFIRSSIVILSYLKFFDLPKVL